jgi:hypothetical protein
MYVSDSLCPLPQNIVCLLCFKSPAAQFKLFVMLYSKPAQHRGAPAKLIPFVSQARVGVGAGARQGATEKKIKKNSQCTCVLHLARIAFLSSPHRETPKNAPEKNGKGGKN